MKSTHNNVLQPLSWNLVTQTSRGRHNTSTPLPFPQKVPTIEDIKKTPTDISV